MWVVVIYNKEEHGLIDKVYGPFTKASEAGKFGMAYSIKYGREWDCFELDAAL